MINNHSNELVAAIMLVANVKGNRETVYVGHCVK